MSKKSIPQATEAKHDRHHATCETLPQHTKELMKLKDQVEKTTGPGQVRPASVDDAVKHCAAGLGIWPWPSNDEGGEPDVVMACCGDVPTLETLAAVDLMRRHLPDVTVRVVNVVNLMKPQSPSEHPHGLSDEEFDAMFTRDRQIIVAFHGYPTLIHRLTYRRTNHRNLHVRGFKEEGTTTTPFDMVVLNDMDRCHLVCDVIDRVPGLATRAVEVRHTMVEKRAEHTRYIAEHGEDMPEIRHGKWGSAQ